MRASDAANIVSHQDYVLAGSVFLEEINGIEVEDASGPDVLRLIATALQPAPTARVAHLKGAFSLIGCFESAKTLIAARDAIGLKTLYYLETSDGIHISDKADELPSLHNHDDDFIAEFIASGGCCFDRTIWRDVRPIPAGHVLAVTDGRARVSAYWSTSLFRCSQDGLDTQEHGRELYRLIERAVRRTIDSDRRTWAHLSGGLDSSSVVCLAGAASASGRSAALGGTVTYTDSLANGDETEFVSEVLTRYPLANHRIPDDWPWRADGELPPKTDQPARDYPFYARDRRTAAVIRAGGGTSVLSGVGPDVYFPVNALYIADWLRAGKVVASTRATYQWALATSQSVWKVAANDLLLPFVQLGGGPAGATPLEPPDWLATSFKSRTSFAERLQKQRSPGSRPGGRYLASLSQSLCRVSGSLPHWHPLPGIDTRHPWLAQSVVEFVLSSPLDLRTHPYVSKRLLRIAMRGVLPDRLRRRTTKGTLEPRICWSFSKERRRLAALLSDSVLASIGCVEPTKVNGALRAWETGAGHSPVSLHAMLALETWLSARVGRCIPELTQC